MLFNEQVLPDGQIKPQSKHLHIHAEHLLKVLHKHIDGSTKASVTFTFCLLAVCLFFLFSVTDYLFTCGCC